MILVTGATGTVGSEVVRLLASGGIRVRAMTRDPAKVPALRGVEAVRGDFGDRESLAAAARGAEGLFLLSAPGPWMAGHDEAMIAAARAAGMRKVVKVSAIGTGERAGAKVGDWHLAGERALESGDTEWTVLRPSSFASNALSWAAQIRTGAPIPNMMGQGRQGVIDPRDVAEVAVRALTPGVRAREALTLTGPELISVPGMAGVLGEVLGGRRVETVDVPLEVYRERLVAAGVDPVFADVAVDGAELVARDGNARLTGEVELVLGRPPRTFAAWAYDHRDAFVAV
ncbi:NAD(P)H-binding protein [Nonomuraea sp. NPDC050404]|uniref:NAD(P)H-binding protein n=1 Tax=Nonomuraea sp. NPDC050404 TaxID=3155783 RepID=UPI0033CAF125